MKKHSYRSILIQTFKKRSTRNAGYKMSAFARDLGITQSRLTEILKGRQGLSKELASKICDRLGFSPIEKNRFCLLVSQAHARSQKEKNIATAELLKLDERTEIHYLDPAQTSWIKWYHLAILSLFETTEKEVTARSASEKLGIRITDAEEALTSLVFQNFLLNQNNKFVLNTPRIEGLIFSGTTPEAMRALNIEMMEKAKEAMLDAPIAERQIGTSIFALNKAELQEFKNMIRDFRRAIEKKADELSHKTSVYGLGIQFFEIC